MKIVAIVLFLGVATAVSLYPNVWRPEVPWDKLAHALLYLVLTLLSCWLIGRAYYWQVCVGLALFGGAMEVLQSFVPGRSMSLADFVADVVGVILGVTAMTLLGVRRRPESAASEPARKI